MGCLGRVRRTALVATVGATLLVGIGFTLARGLRTNAPEVDAVQVQQRTLVRTVTATGTVAALEVLDVKYTLQDRVEKLFVREGDSVRRGQLLARMDVRLLEPQVRQARAALAKTEAQLAQARRLLAQANALREGREEEAPPGELTPTQATIVRTRIQVAQAERNWRRLEGLARVGYIAAADADGAESAWRALQRQLRVDEAAALNEAESAAAAVQALEAQRASDMAALRLAEEQLDRANIRAPLDGVVASLLVGEGEFLGSSQGARASGKPQNVLMTLVNPASLVVFADIHAVDIGEVAPAQAASINPIGMAGADPVAGVLRVIAAEPAVVNNITLYRATVVLISRRSGLRLGMPVTVEIETARAEDVLALPAAAVRRGEAQGWVAVIRSDHVLRVPVRVGLRTAMMVELRQGITPADVVLLDPEALPEGTKVSARPRRWPAAVGGAENSEIIRLPRPPAKGILQRLLGG